MPPTIRIIEGDLLDQKVDVIVNAWNRNIIPWWLLLPQGVSGAIKRRGGYQPFRELSKHGPIPLGEAVHTSAGKLPFKGIIHVAGINMLWFATEKSIRKSVRSALELATEKGYCSIAFPLIGAGTGGASQEKTFHLILEEIEQSTFDGEVTVVKFGKERFQPSNVLLEMEKDKHEAQLKATEPHDYPEYIPPTNRQELYRRIEELAAQRKGNTVIYGSHEFSENDLLDALLEQAYEGPEHRQVHEELLDFIRTASHHFLRHSIWLFSNDEFDALVLRIHILAIVMKRVNWDGLSPMYDFPKFKEPDYLLLCQTIGEDLFMDSQRMPQSNINRLDILLCSDDRQVVIATLLYLHAWLTSGGPKDLRLTAIRPILNEYAQSSDELLKKHTEGIYYMLDYLAKKK